MPFVRVGSREQMSFISLLQQCREGRRGVKERRIWLPFLLLYETIMYSISVQIVVLLDAKRGIYIYDLYCNCGIDRGSFLCHFLHACYIYMTKQYVPHACMQHICFIQHIFALLVDLSFASCMHVYIGGEGGLSTKIS